MPVGFASRATRSEARLYGATYAYGPVDNGLICIDNGHPVHANDNAFR